MKHFIVILSLIFFAIGAKSQHMPLVKTNDGELEGINESGIKIFKGIPFASPPIGELRWKAPRAVKKWEGVRKAQKFGPNPMQEHVYGDMNFGTEIMSEDCLYLNIWTPAKTMHEKLPVFIYFNGGGLVAGSGSEARYAGLSMARRGIVAITANYREGIFGFFSHPQLSKETYYKGSGNYGFMDQAAAIRWVKENISVFGGDPNRITIMGESSGSESVSALMVSPLSRNLVNQAMGSSGSVLGLKKIATLTEAERAGEKLAKKIGCNKIEDLRAMPAEELMKRASLKDDILYNVDGYFITEQPEITFAKGKQAHIPCLIGNNSTEMLPQYMFNGKSMTMENLKLIVEENMRLPAENVLSLYGIHSDSDIITLSGCQLASDMFVVFSTWKWADMQQKTCGEPVYRYIYCHPRPKIVEDNVVDTDRGMQKEKNDVMQPLIIGAVHSADIEYEMGTLPTNRVFAWDADDYAVSDIFESYFVNFIKTGNPNGLGLPDWQPANDQLTTPVMYIGLDTHLGEDTIMEKRYRIIDAAKTNLHQMHFGNSVDATYDSILTTPFCPQ